MKGIIIFVFLFVFSLSNSLCAETSDIIIGWTGPLSGNSAVVGTDSVGSVKLAIDEINANGGIKGHKLRLVSEDDQYNVPKAVTAYQKLVSVDHASVVLVSTYGGTFATAERALRDNVIVIDTLDCNDDLAALSENTFCIGTQTESIAEGMAQDILDRHLGPSLVLLEESDGWMQFLERALRRILTAKGITVLTESSDASATDYRASLLRGKKAGVRSLVVLGNDQMGLAPRQAHDLGMTLQLYGIGSILSPGFQGLAGQTIEGAKASSWLAPSSKVRTDFLNSFVQKYQRKPYLELASFPAYDAMRLVGICLDKALDPSGAMLSSELRKCLLSKFDYHGVSGTISFDPDGAVRSLKERLYTVKNRKLDIKEQN